ncbi:hypothetical protein Mal64_36160 [Pseudobythopirellula maris]|uniref:Uncharacterized protein n=1 Tax=Pseudobythopirellula maris TaxID=2527991 RepID=A0A5C5ZHT1_9BACT|nr:hypothetical protein [Pseudobythopirellula maris]TWT86786.1 hypothetical protein Mal64_36160 [Pseudobythopirellula maris]
MSAKNIAFLLMLLFVTAGQATAVGEEEGCDICEKLEELLEATEGLEVDPPTGVDAAPPVRDQPDYLDTPAVNWSLPEIDTGASNINVLTVPVPGDNSFDFAFTGVLENSPALYIFGSTQAAVSSYLAYLRTGVRAFALLYVWFRFAINCSALIRNL